MNLTVLIGNFQDDLTARGAAYGGRVDLEIPENPLKFNILNHRGPRL